MSDKKTNQYEMSTKTQSLTDFDENFKTNAAFETDEYDFYDIRKPPFRIYGLYKPETEYPFKRLPDEISRNVSKAVHTLSYNTSGGRVRFKTNSNRIAIKVSLRSFCLMPHMTIAGSCGFDAYVKEENEYIYKATFFTEWGNNIARRVIDAGGYMSVAEIGADNQMQDVTINFPLYNNVDAVYIGIEKGAILDKGDKYKDVLPVIYYGSSITQGGCASRPGNNYPNILSRRHDTDFYNLGFSGSARGETEIAQYIADMPMSCFVYCYDFNAPTSEHLRNTHENMYNIIRCKKPDIPVIFKTRPRLYLNAEEKERKEIVYNTYSQAKRKGHNVYFIDGQEIFKMFGGDCCTVDGKHPNDLGFMCIAESIDEIFKKIY